MFIDAHIAQRHWSFPVPHPSAAGVAAKKAKLPAKRVPKPVELPGQAPPKYARRKDEVNARLPFTLLLLERYGGICDSGFSLQRCVILPHSP